MEKAALKWKSQIRSCFPAVRAAAADRCCAENTGRWPGALPALRARCLPRRGPRRRPGGGRDPPFSPAWVGEPNPRAWLSAGSLIALECGGGRRFPCKLSEPTAKEAGDPRPPRAAGVASLGHCRAPGHWMGQAVCHPPNPAADTERLPLRIPLRIPPRIPPRIPACRSLAAVSPRPRQPRGGRASLLRWGGAGWACSCLQLPLSLLGFPTPCRVCLGSLSSKTEGGREEGKGVSCKGCCCRRRRCWRQIGDIKDLAGGRLWFQLVQALTPRGEGRSGARREKRGRQRQRGARRGQPQCVDYPLLHYAGATVPLKGVCTRPAGLDCSAAVPYEEGTSE